MSSTAGRAETFTLLHKFGQGQDAANPQSGFVYRGGTLYGTTYYGGPVSSGTVYKIDPASRKESVLHSFGPAPDGINPYAGLLYQDGALYGTTLQGGGLGRGTIFRVNPRTGRSTILSDFGSTSATGGSYGELIGVKGWLFGTSSGGGPADAGTVFGYKVSDGTVRILYSFKGGPTGADGAYPYSRLVYHDGELYGTTAGGGSGNGGTIFKVSPSTGARTILHRFKGGPDGRGPRSGLVLLRGKLYGTTPAGGGDGCGGIGCGTLYGLDPASGAYGVVHRFLGGDDGATPSAPPTVFRGDLYGTTASGGKGCGNGCGTIFSYDVAAKRETVAYRLRELIDGQYPTAPLTECAGALCGTTSSGSDFFNGTAFRFEP